MRQAVFEDGAVLTCTALECSYNQGEVCHATAIQVGSEHPVCDTFTMGRPGSMDEDAAGVGACAILDCTFNASRHCRAPGITVGVHSEHADCITFRPG